MFGRKKDKEGKLLKKLRDWMAEQMAEGHSRQELASAFLQAGAKLKLKDPEFHEKYQAYNVLERELSQVMVDRNTKGGELLEKGKEEEAIKLFEANLADQFMGGYPYERLRIIYSKRLDYRNAIRVCEAAISNPHFPKKDKYIEWRHKYQQKL